MTALTVNVTVNGVDVSCTSQPLKLRWHVGVPHEANDSDRHPPVPALRTCSGITRKVHTLMDLQADKKVALSLEFTDELDNVVTAPADAVTVYSVDDPNIIALTDNGDGTASAAATGVLGTANVHVEVDFTDEDGAAHHVTGDLQLVVVAGNAERVAVVAGEPEEVTPDV
jgi:hypothetical protein